jgi:hypothetical protein
MRLTLSIAGGLLLAISFAIVGGIGWFSHPVLREWPLADGYSPLVLGVPLGGLLGVTIWILIKDRGWAKAWMIALGSISSLFAFPGFHKAATISDGWDSLRTELTFYFWLTVFSGSLFVLFAGIVASFRSRLIENEVPEKTKLFNA